LVVEATLAVAILAVLPAALIVPTKAPRPARPLSQSMIIATPLTLKRPSHDW
jgi:hypothetical protein